VGGAVLAFSIFLTGLAQETNHSSPDIAPARANAARSEPIKPIPQMVRVDRKIVALGRKLFEDPQLSRDNQVSCASCHSFAKGGADARARSLGVNGLEGGINAPSVFNCGFNFRQFWDGRAGSLEEQIDGPIQAPKEMASSWDDIVRKLKISAPYVAAFQAIYPEGIQRETIKDALAEFERSLITPNARFDQYLRGNESILSAAEKSGYHKFKVFGCISCHQGVNVGGNMFETFGVMGDYFATRGHVTKDDLGRFNVTGREQDRYVFRVPSLRNVALTAPYFHDGSAATLKEAVGVMAEYQLGRALSAEDIEEITQFLRTLTGEFEGKPL
jgi:cytochrome c peroxidase